MPKALRPWRNREHLLVQAPGTGTGKSCYLVPLLTHCATNGVRRVVSTATLALQHEFSSRTRRWSSCGRVGRWSAPGRGGAQTGQYACLHKLPEHLFEDRDVGPTGEARQRRSARRVDQRDHDGDRDDLVPRRLRIAPGTTPRSQPECLGCPHRPVLAQAASRPRRADVVVTNHSLFEYINACGGRAFRRADAVVIDEEPTN